MESVSSNLLTDADFRQLASTCSDFKTGGKSGQKCSVFQALSEKIRIEVFSFAVLKVNDADITPPGVTDTS